MTPPSSPGLGDIGRAQGKSQIARNPDLSGNNLYKARSGEKALRQQPGDDDERVGQPGNHALKREDAKEECLGRLEGQGSVHDAFETMQAEELGDLFSGCSQDVG